MPIIIHLMALGTVVLDIALVVAIGVSFSKSWRAKMAALIQPRVLDYIFLLSAACVVGTLLLQYADNLVPCLLCWWQRVFMYPIAFIGGIAIAKKQKASSIADYVLALSVPGAAVALYQHILQILPTGSLPAPCDASGDCAARLVFEYGFVTLPWMAFTAFAALFVLALIARQEP